MIRFQSSFSRHSRPSALFLALYLILVFVLQACTRKANETPNTDSPVEVGVLLAVPEVTVERTYLSGRLSASNVAEIRPQISGIVSKRMFTEGSEVSQGQVLYIINSEVYESIYRQSKASLARAQASLKIAKSRRSRDVELVKYAAMSQQDYEDVVAAEEEAGADVGIAKAALESARLNVSYTRIVSPIRGRIGRSSVTAGALVMNGQSSALAIVQSIDQMYLDVTRPSEDLLRVHGEIKRGLMHATSSACKVQIMLGTGAVYPQLGRLSFTDITVDPTTDSVNLRVEVPNVEHELLPGMFVQAVLEDGVNEDAILIPQLAVTRNADGHDSVWLIDAANRAHQVTVKAERADGTRWVVSDGLKSGDRVVTSGAGQLQDGTPVRVASQDNSKGMTATIVNQGS